MRNLAVKALLLTLWLPSMASAQGLDIWEPDGSGLGYYGGNGTAAGGDIVGDVRGFDILNLTAVQSGGSITISVLTNFSEQELINNGNDVSKIIFGDLMLSTGYGSDPWHPDTAESCGAGPGTGAANYHCDTASSPGGTQWNYALQTLHPGAQFPFDTATGSGAIYSVTNPATDLLNSSSAYAQNNLQDGVRRDNQYIGLAPGGGTDTGKTSNETVTSVSILQPADPLNDPSCTINPDACTDYIQGSLLTYTISLADIGFAGPDYTNAYVAIRWTMSCANDIVEGVLQLSSVVPEPESLALFLGGLAGLGLLSRRPKRPAKEESLPS